MANVLWGKGREGFLDGSIDWDTATIKAILVRGYTFSDSHKFVSDITGAGGSIVSTSPAFANKAATNGVADADDVVFPAVPGGAPIPVVAIFQSSAVTGGADVAASAQRLIAHLDTGTNFPLTPTGQSVTLSFDNGTLRIFRL